MGFEQYPNPPFGLQGGRPSQQHHWEHQRGAYNRGEDLNEMPYGPDSGSYHQQSGRPQNERDLEYAERYHRRGQPAPFMPPPSPETSHDHSSGPARKEKLDAESRTEDSGEKPEAYLDDNEEKHRREMEKLQQLHEDKIIELSVAHEDRVKQLEEKHTDIAKDLAQACEELKRQLWIREVEIFCSMQPKDSDGYAETYRKLTEEFTLLGLDVDQPESSDQQKFSGGETMPYYQKKLLRLHNSYVQTQVNRQDYRSVEELQAFPRMIKDWSDINTAEWRQAYSLWCTVLRKSGDEFVQDYLRDIWPKTKTEGESTEARLWRLQIGDELCDLLGASKAGIALRERMLEDREKAHKELHDVTVQARLRQDTVLTHLSLAQIYLDQLHAINPDQSRTSGKRSALCEESVAILEKIWDDEPRLEPTSTMLTVGQKLGCLLYREYRQDQAGKARTILEAVWRTRKAHLPRDLEDTLITGHYLFLTYVHLQEYSEAKSVFEEVWRTTEFMRKSHSDRTLNFYCLLTDFLRQNAPGGAKYGAATNLLGNSNDPDQLKLCMEIGMVFFRDKKYPEAECILRQAYNAYKTSGVLGLRQNDDALACGRCLAEAVAEQTKYSSALQIFEEVLPERARGDSEAHQADELRFRRLYSDVLMKQANCEISSNFRSPKIVGLYVQATEVFPQIVQDVFKRPEMHKCARHLLLELVSLRKFAEAESLLEKILEYPEFVSQEILPCSFRYKLCKSVMEVRNYEMAIGLFGKMMERPKGGQEQLRAQDVSGDLGYCLLEAGKPEEALNVFENTREILSKACQAVEDAIARVRDLPTLMVTPIKEQRPIEKPTPTTKAAPKAKEAPEANPRPKLKSLATEEARPSSAGRGSVESQSRRRHTGSSVYTESLRSESPKNAPRRKSDESPRRRREPRRKDRGRLEFLGIKI